MHFPLMHSMPDMLCLLATPLLFALWSTICGVCTLPNTIEVRRDQEDVQCDEEMCLFFLLHTVFDVVCLPPRFTFPPSVPELLQQHQGWGHALLQPNPPPRTHERHGPRCEVLLPRR